VRLLPCLVSCFSVHSLAQQPHLLERVERGLASLASRHQNLMSSEQVSLSTLYEQHANAWACKKWMCSQSALEGKSTLSSRLAGACVVLAVGFHPSLLLPYWSGSSRPGETLLSERIAAHVLGISDLRECEDATHLYVYDEQLSGDCHGDLIASALQLYLDQQWSQSASARLVLLLPTSGVFFSRVLLCWAAQQVCRLSGAVECGSVQESAV
jgi:hypothetical protein